MFTFIAVTAFVSAAPDVLVVSGGDFAKVKALLPAGAQWVDGSTVHASLFKNDLLDFSTFDGFSAAPVADWPAELKSTWADALTYCAEIAGPTPWLSSKLVGARCCGQRLSLHLWGRYLEAQRAEQVYVIDISDEPKGVSVSGVRYAAASADSTELNETGASGSSAALVKKVVDGLVKGEGTTRKRTVNPTLFRAMPVDPWTAGGELKPLELKKKCDALPAKLKFKEKSATTTALASRWSAANPGKGAALKCAVSFSTHFELPNADLLIKGLPQEVVTTVLRCDLHTASNELMKGLRGGPRPPMELITTDLAEGLANRICK